jgi:6-pyruvoyltetrahydropterin/6-carboxytetrahydropterin synthase
MTLKMEKTTNLQLKQILPYLNQKTCTHVYELEKIFHFEAGHVLDHHDGKCRHPHGHSYTLKVKIMAEELITSGPQTNMLMDFARISDIIKPMIATYFDHHWLNDSLKTDSPSAEFMAKWIYDYLEPKLNGLYSITICETNTCSATYRKKIY